MTEETKRAARECKAAVSAWLRAAVYPRALDDTDARLREYVAAVVSNCDGHNLYELLAVKRFFEFYERYEWDVASVRRFLKFYEAIRFSGVTGRRRYKLTPIQVFQFANIFGFKSGGKRLCRTAYIFVPRKFSKTTAAAALAVYDLLFGDNNAQAYVAANSYEQAKICFDEIRAVMRDIDPGERHFRVNREKITYKDRGRDSLIRCLTANAKTQDGLFASLVIMDEYAQARSTANKSGADLKNVLTSSMGPRREPLTLIISTASDVVDGVFFHELEGVKSVLRGELENDSIFASLFMPDVDDKEGDPRTWAKVQPHIGVTVQADFYAREYANACLSADAMLAFRTKLLNVFAVNDVKTWIPYKRAAGLLGRFDIDAVAGFPLCAVAFDLSVRDDFSAVTYTVYNSADKRFYSYTDYYLPAGTLPGHHNEQLYRRWVEMGALQLCDGERIDVNRIAEDILRRARRLNIVRIVYDGWKAQDLVNILGSVGGRDVLQPYSQTYGSFNLPVEAFEMMIYDTPPRIVLNNNPINLFCLGNCVIDTDRLENKKPVKISHARKIDGVITLLMTIGAINSYRR